MDVLADIKQESAAVACEKWQMRPRIDFPFDGTDIGTRLYQVFASCSSTRVVFYKCVLKSTLKSEGKLLIIDCDHTVKFGQLLANFSSEQLNDKVDFFGIYNYSSYCSLWEEMPRILFERPNVSTAVFSGISNPYFYHQKRRQDKQITTMVNFASLQVEKIRKYLENYNITAFLMYAQDTEENSMLPPNVNGKINFLKTPSEVICKFKNSPNEPVIQINCLF